MLRVQLFIDFKSYCIAAFPLWHHRYLQLIKFQPQINSAKQANHFTAALFS